MAKGYLDGHLQGRNFEKRIDNLPSSPGIPPPGIVRPGEAKRRAGGHEPRLSMPAVARMTT
jgi:hypothetical protein